MSENKLYKCVFFHNRSCSLREQMDWDDDKIKSEEREYKSSMDSTRINYLKPLDYLMHFCDRCPHTRTNTKLVTLIDLLNVANPITDAFKKEVQKKIRSYL